MRKSKATYQIRWNDGPLYVKNYLNGEVRGEHSSISELLEGIESFLAEFPLDKDCHGAELHFTICRKTDYYGNEPQPFDPPKKKDTTDD